MPLPVLVIAGPTASGKSGLALDLALQENGVIINADSVQLYRGLPILSAKPSKEDCARAPHALYATLNPNEQATAATWRDLALSEISKTHAAGKLPIIVGGTGFYLKALLEGMSPLPDVDEKYRAAATAEQIKRGNPGFHEFLAAQDPETAAKLDPFNTQRLVRAYEVLLATGKGLASWQAAPPIAPPADLSFQTVFLAPPRETLYRSCDDRLEKMLSMGALDEVRALKEKIDEGSVPPAATITKALGYHPLATHLNSEITLDEAQDIARRDTRHYAKRQVTWFKHQFKAAFTLEKPDAGLLMGKIKI